ncbi:hypothetical protein CLV62_104113 [Dysgonomonas alginatilytica]|uniref:Uncharacterized protein n=1 Tax=Dysgonomonas alginatilytica TaxID=1605892 RepID=A0A2V3PYI7_9BACT|nr:hypothetical protein [Dysgonomonas alginatilytica]PXV66852.1 hypothetical protein CLV62_104113 [Dysgonomonas alginatilytica]
MTLETQFAEGDKVWVLNAKTGNIVQREVAGVRTQSINKTQNTIYCFVKDWCLQKENPTLEDCFWLPEGKVFDTKTRLIQSFQ